MTEFLTCNEVAEILNVSRSKIYEMVRNSRKSSDGIPFAKIGGTVLIPKADFYHWVEQQIHNKVV